MKPPKGFGKTYFSLSSILAHSVERTMHSQISAFTSLVCCSFSSEDELEEDDPPAEILDLHTFHNESKPCQCNCYFKHLTHIKLALYHYIPRCPFYTTFYAFRRTGVHPPILSFS